jgi:Skp family chaperone for outer membrane proteins|eukprot:CAMPEP_0174281042 /NCGR_PEP_ID=MMETSP0809-20121228/1370_1 /TAXON_ID=73025 ORGANISM="Eutreptiella gymnastica-like, Strain CCMP1594" /NCGR_SAMPLE_ID=MMETSP0809 /ASSEMBLY_ACC=CAM_ASM_000658 /LENGTH=459 /DNA_ID=CAMNT_0015374313 /DNA_START=21 /DNA_END=1400 /DNA_ORIENTATION=+
MTLPITSLKTYFKDEVRRIGGGEISSDDWKGFCARLRSLHHHDLKGIDDCKYGYRIRYYDDEGEEVTIRSMDEVIEACSLTTDGVLRLNILRAKALESKIMEASEVVLEPTLDLIQCPGEDDPTTGTSMDGEDSSEPLSSVDSVCQATMSAYSKIADAVKSESDGAAEQIDAKQLVRQEVKSTRTEAKARWLVENAYKKKLAKAEKRAAKAEQRAQKLEKKAERRVQRAQMKAKRAHEKVNEAAEQNSATALWVLPEAAKTPLPGSPAAVEPDVVVVTSQPTQEDELDVSLLDSTTMEATDVNTTTTASTVVCSVMSSMDCASVSSVSDRSSADNEYELIAPVNTEGTHTQELPRGPSSGPMRPEERKEAKQLKSIAKALKKAAKAEKRAAKAEQKALKAERRTRKAEAEAQRAEKKAEEAEKKAERRTRKAEAEARRAEKKAEKAEKKAESDAPVQQD